MSVWNSVLGFIGWQSDKCSLADPVPCPRAINPATGLPMLQGDCGGVDFGGRPFGVDLNSDAVGFELFQSSDGGIDGWD